MSVPKFGIVHSPCLHGVKSDCFLTVLHLIFNSSLILPLFISSSCVVLVPSHLLHTSLHFLNHFSFFSPFCPFFVAAVTIFCSPVFNLFYIAVIVAGVLDRVTVGYLFNALILPCKRNAARPSLQIILNFQVNSLHTYPVGLSTSRAH